MKYVIWFLLFTFSISAQVKGVVVDENNYPISYACIWVQNEELGTTTEEDGTFSIAITPDKQLIFSAMGFEKQIMSAALSQKVILKRRAIRLDEVIVEKRKQTIERIIENKNTQKGTFLTGNKGMLIAKFFPYDSSYKSTKFLKKIIVETRSKVKDASFKLHLFLKDENGKPGQDLIDEDIIVTVNNGKKENMIDISKYNLTFPKEGFFVACESLLIEKNKYEDEYTIKGSSIKHTEIYFAPGLVSKIAEEANTFHWYKGEWIQTKPILNFDKTNEASMFNGKIIEPVINLILTN